MSPRLSKQPVISRTDLERIAEERLREAEALLEAGCFTGAVYLGGYAVEAYLKSAICRRLRWEHLLGAFKTHDLEGLLLYAGLAPDLDADKAVEKSFHEVAAIWNDEQGEATVRYANPEEIDEKTARSFLRCVLGDPEGLIPWLRNRTS